MLKKAFITVFLLALLCNSGIYEVQAQGQPPPLMPPHILYGTAYVDGSPLGQFDTDKTVSIEMERLLLIFLDDFDSQANIAAIIGELNIGNTDALQQAFADSAYCQSRGTTLSNDASVTETLLNEWRVVDAGTTYTVLNQVIDVWSGVAWVAGNKLEVYQHDGVIISYTMGEYSVNEYVLEVPMSSGTIFGGLSPNTYVNREPGKALAGEGATININNIEITDPAGSYILGEEAFIEIDIHAPSTYEVNISLSTDWNLVSLPVEPENTDRDVVLESIDEKYDEIWAFDSREDKWLRYVPDGLPILNDLNEVMSGMGYWIKMNQPGTLTVQGTLPGTVIALKLDWNLVGYNSMDSKDILVALFSIDGKYTEVWAYVEDKWLRYVPDGLPILNDLDSMDPTKGYWIKATEDVDWDIEP